MRLLTARLHESQTQRILALESALDSRIVAVEPVEELAHLASNNLRRLSELERDLDVVLVAYRISDARPAGGSTAGWASHEMRLPFTRLTAEQTRMLRDVETDMAVILLCYELNRAG